MSRLRIEDLPDRVRRQVEDKIRSEDGKRARIAQDAQEPDGRAKTREDASGRGTRAVEAKRRAPNKTEADYNRTHLGGKGRYEAVTLRLPGGSRYTPDFVTVSWEEATFGIDCIDVPKVTLHEVKGGYRLGSHGRALTAFREAVAAFPFFDFVWAVRKGPGEWDIKKHAGRENHA